MVSPKLFQQYVGNRQIRDQDLMNETMMLLRANADKKLVMEHGHKIGGVQLTRKQLHNIEARRKKLLGPECQQVKEILEEEVRNGASAKLVIQESTKDVQGMHIVTPFMKKAFNWCPQIVFVDSTFNVNNNNYSLLAFVVMDAFGHGQIVQMSLQNSNSASNFEGAVKNFKETQERWRDIKVFITDKDLKEVHVLEKEFPAAESLLCTSHVSKGFREECIKAVYGLNERQQEDVKAHMDLMIETRTRHESDELDTYLLETILEVCTQLHSMYTVTMGLTQ